ncbi:MAG: N-6 DNA methylase [bacterium]|nr:N-6 DNA methylase [bacterium]
MLTNGTKRRIDTARDILVGKLPDPKSQVEQITIALIYKFMDDMDKQAEELGGRSKFFTGEYAKYAWSKIFDPRVSGHELVGLYGEAIQRMNHNPNIPQLFRDIFKNAYLPYRDPETLKSFLKVIGEFEYDHSEKLGDAFEYLLSIMGSQGDAGQFRTPRHIIDFIVKVVDPKKNETILDPACGTAGFLISSYKHILEKNKKDDRVHLTPDEKKRLIENFSGYDISPDMVRLSLANMYLHKFQNPKIYEYDTLSSEEKWQEVFDVILANPPFMSPKGGIKPHKRFSVQAKRSEVLFVDYIAEHLNPNGRAGIIVPEGIIFKTETAYKKLRKMLIEYSLYAVVSLPPGVFNPYAGVKTSILLLDKNLAKKTDKILFVKINNDGFGLGAQRREIKENDLPMALEILQRWQKTVGAENFQPNEKIAYAVGKTKIAESGDYNLSGDRYREAVIYSGKWDFVEVEDAIEKIEYSTKIKKEKFLNEGKYPIVDQSEKFIAGYWNGEEDVFRVSEPLVIFGDHTKCFKYIDFDFVLGADGVKILKPTDEYIPRFFYFILENLKIKNLGYSRHFKELKRIKIPLPPLEVQEQIVAELDNYQKIIDGAKQVVENYKPAFKIDPDWEMVELGNVLAVNADTVDPKKKYGENKFVYIDITSVENGTGIVSFNNRIKGIDAPSRARRVVRNGDVLLSTVRPNLKAFCYLSELPKSTIASTGFAVLTASSKVVPQFVYYQLFGEYLQKQMIDRMGKGAYPSINQKDVQELKIFLPSLEIQEEVVSRIRKEWKAVEANKELITIFGQNIKDKIKEVWGE